MSQRILALYQQIQKVARRIAELDHSPDNSGQRQELLLKAFAELCQAWGALHIVEGQLRSQAFQELASLWEQLNEQKQAQAELSLLRFAMQQVKDAILITTAQLNEPGPAILFANQAFTQMSGYLAEEIRGKTPRILQGPQTDRSVLRQLRQTLQKGQPFEGTLINYRKNSTAYRVQLHCIPIHNDHGDITHFVSIQQELGQSQEAVPEHF